MDRTHPYCLTLEDKVGGEQTAVHAGWHGVQGKLGLKRAAHEHQHAVWPNTIAAAIIRGHVGILDPGLLQQLGTELGDHLQVNGVLNPGPYPGPPPSQTLIVTVTAQMFVGVSSSPSRGTGQAPTIPRLALSLPGGGQSPSDSLPGEGVIARVFQGKAWWPPTMQANKTRVNGLLH